MVSGECLSSAQFFFLEQKTTGQSKHSNGSIMNRLAIELNNFGVEELKKGNLLKGFELLSDASNLTSQSHHAHVDSKRQTFRYHWEDCAPVLNKLLVPLHNTGEGCTPFLSFRFLRVTTPDANEDIERYCPCAFAWVLWFK